jgi:hypothetical protein
MIYFKQVVYMMSKKMNMGLFRLKSAGKRLNNNVFTQLVESDVDFCVKQFPAFVHAYKIINGIPTK